jgi:hypothetical protein
MPPATPGCRAALTSVASPIMQTGKPKDAQGRKAVTIPKVSRVRLCTRCPFYDPSGKCLDKTLRSGRCGDWIWSVKNGRQIRRLWTQPRDPRTRLQLQCRARLAAASKRYSQGLPDGQQEACIAAGARLQSRPRLFQSGPLTGQQYWVRQECARKAAVDAPSAGTVAKPLQTKGISASTWEHCCCAAVALPWQCRRRTAPPGRMVRIWRVREGCLPGQSCRNGRPRGLWRGGLAAPCGKSAPRHAGSDHVTELMTETTNRNTTGSSELIEGGLGEPYAAAALSSTNCPPLVFK